MSQIEVAEAICVSRQTISRWESGSAVPSAENLKYLSRFYNVSLEYLLDDDEKESIGKETEESCRMNNSKSKKKIAIAITVIIIAISILIAVVVHESEKMQPRQDSMTDIDMLESDRISEKIEEEAFFSER